MLSLVESFNKANIFLGLIEYELNSLLGSSHLANHISVHIRFDLERYLLIITGRHFHENMKVQTAMCKDNNNSKGRAATYVKFDTYLKY